MHGAEGILVADFDGTITRRDFYDLVRRQWPARDRASDPWERYVAGEATHFEALREIFLQPGASEADFLSLAEDMEIFADFAPAVRALQAHGWEVVIASAGCRWYIDRLLAHAGVNVTVHGNPGAFVPGRGLVMSQPGRGRFFIEETGVNKLAIVRDALERSACAAFAGDGRPDLEPALLVPPERRFARGWLAGEFDRRSESYRALESWSVLAESLLS